MNMPRRPIVAFASAALLVAACSSGGTPAPSGAAGGASLSPGESSAGTSAGASAGASFSQIGGTVTVLGTWTGAEQDSFLAMVKPWEDMTGAKVQYTGTRDLNTQLAAGVKSGQLPDLAGLPGIGPMQEYAASGALQDLGSIIDPNAYASTISKPLFDLTNVNGKLVGVLIKLSVKGNIWYDPKVVSVSTPPATWDDLQKLIAQDQSKAKNAWCMGLESGAASGWPGTDWIEDFLLRTAGPDTFQKWAQGQVKWSDPQVKNAWTMFGDVVKNSYGGPSYIAATNFANGGDKLFANPPGCLFHHQASFITGLGAFANLKAGTDYNFFPFPDIDAQYKGALEGGGDLFGEFHRTPQADSLMKWLVTAQAQEIWVKRGGALAANNQVPLSAYPTDTDRASAQLYLNAGNNFVYDGSDQMPTAMNDAFYKAVLQFVQDPSQLDSILQNLDQTQSSSYGG